MRLYFFISLLVFFIPFSASAQEIVKVPICFFVINEAPYSVLGSFVTDQYTRPDGIKARHRSNFRLEEPGTMHEGDETSGGKPYPLDKAEFCTYGPFYPNRQLEFVIRTLVPIFSCKTRIEDGPIVIKGYKKPGGGTETWAECYQ